MRKVKGRPIIGTLIMVMNGRNQNMEGKRGIRNIVIQHIIKYATETWIWNTAHQLKLCVKLHNRYE